MNAPLFPLSDALPATLDGWTQLAQERGAFDFWGRAHDGSEETRARFDGATLTLAHWVQSRLVANLALRQSPDGSWRCMISPCLLSSMGSRDPEEMAWADLGEAFATMPPNAERGLRAKAAHALRCMLPSHG